MRRFLKRISSEIRRPTERRQRPRVEVLEDRTNPSGLVLVPMSVVAANPGSLPPSALMQFNPLANLVDLPSAGTTAQIPLNVQGSFQQTLTSPSPAGNPVATPPGHLSVFYNLQGGVSETVATSSTANQPNTLTATFHLTGRLTEVLTMPALSATVPPTWSITTTFSEQGTVTGPLNVAPAGGAATDPMSFTDQVTLTQTEGRPAAAATAGAPWTIQSTLQTSGTFQERVLPPGVASTAVPAPTPFTVQDQITEHVSAVPNPPPPGGTLISASFSAAGSVTVNPLPPGPSAGTPPVVLPVPASGTTQYEEHLTETVSYPPGSANTLPPQTLTQVYDTTGAFQYFPADATLFVPSTGIGETSDTGLTDTSAPAAVLS